MNRVTARGIRTIPLFLCRLALAFSVYQSALAAPPTDFVETDVAGGWNQAVGITFDSNGRIFVWERGGRIWTVDAGVKSSVPFLDISDEVAGYRDFGMLGVALHPNFINNGFIYLSYEVDRHHLEECDEDPSGVGTPICSPSYNPNTNIQYQASIGRITRYSAELPGGDTDYSAATSVDPNSRMVLVGDTDDSGFLLLHESHGSGHLLFGDDGTIIASNGDGASYINVDSGSDGNTYWSQAISDGIMQAKENIGAFRSQLLDSLSGKLIRIDPATGDGVPSNPFFDPANPRSAKSRVWSIGLRNPYRIGIRPNSGSHDPADGDPGSIYVGDVGWGTWEDMQVATVGGQNFGWPLFEGLTPHNGYWNALTENQDEPNPLFGQGGCTQEFFNFQDLLQQDTLAAPLSFPNPCDGSQQIPIESNVFLHTRPPVDWHHGFGPSRTGIFSGDTATEIDLQDPASPVPGPSFGGNAATGGVWYVGTDFPPEYQNTYFGGDYGGEWIRVFRFDSNDQPINVSEFNSDAGRVVFLATHPIEGALYYVTWAPTNRVVKVTYQPSGNQPPDAVASDDVSFGSSPLVVQFTGSNSTDANGDTLTYQWDFGDGSPIDTSANPQHTYTVAGGSPTSFAATLRVEDPSGASDTATLLISVNNTPPSVNILTPADGTLYSLAAATTYSLTADIVDAEHGPGQYSCAWQTTLVHNTHTHDEPVDASCSTTSRISALGCGDESYHWEIGLTVIDDGGLVDSDKVVLLPDCSGTGSVVVPQVVGLTQVSAEQAIISVDLTVGTVGTANHLSVPAGSVISQNPQGLDQAPLGSAVDLVVSLGPVGPVVVPDVIGLSQVAAEGAITSAGLTVGTVSTSTSTTVPAGDVISQSPVGSTSVVAGSAVDLVVSVGATPPPTTIIRVNAGGPDVTDSLGQLWSADNGFNTGSLWDDVGPVAGTVEDALYLTERWDPSGAPELEYAFTVPNGTYEVNLHFAEIANGVAYVGGRVFDVSIEGVLLEDNLDVFAQTGSAFAALIKTHTVSVTDGQINIGFGHVVEDPKISAIEIIGGGVTAPSITLSSPTPGSTVLGPDVTVNYALGGDASAYNHIHFTLDSDPYIADTSMTGTFVFAGVSAGAHTMTAQLVDASHIALTNPESLATVSFTVELPAAVPDVVGLAQAAAESAITSAGLTVGTVTNTASATVPAGDVISQNPVAASQVAPGSAVDLIVSSGPVPVIVPDLVGLAQATAESTIVSVGLAVGAATTASSDTIPSGSVISQSPLAATSVAPGTAVDLVISTGPAPVTVPDVVGLAQAAAESAITSAGLTVGTVSTSTSTTVPAGDVISQSPVGSTSVVAGSAVDLVVSVGATPPPTTIIRVNAGGPDVTDSLGQLWSADNGFNTGSLWDDVGPVAGTVEDALYLTERWDPSGAPELEYAFTVPNGTYEVNLHFAEIANGVAYVGGRVFDVSIEGVLLEDNLDVFAQTGSAFAALIKTHTVSVTDGQINIGFGHVVEDPKISAIEIIGGGVTAPSITLSSPTPGSTVLGPDVTVNYALGGDASAYNHIHFTLDSDPYIADTSMTGTFVFAGVSAGAHTMTAQLVDASHIALTNPESLATVSFTVELPAAVPDVVGLAQAAAESAITSAGLTVGTVTNTASATVPAGDVISQNPVAASQVAPGSAVDLVVSTGPAPIVVPDVVGLTQAAAESAITSVGLSVGTVSTSASPTVPDGSVISQDPLAATSVAPGTAVDLVISTGPAPVTVPDVVGLAQVAAESAITSAGLTVGTITNSESDTVPAGDVISQSPLGGLSVPAASPVILEVSAGPAPIPVPDVVGLAQVTAENAIVAAGLTVGNVTTASSLTIPSGDVISQNPIAGTLATAASAVDLVVSSGAVSVPDVTGLTQSQADAALTSVGLATGIVTTENSATIPAGSVIHQNPIGGASVLGGSAVDIVVSIGPANQAPAVYAGPDLAGTVATSVHVDDATASDDGLPVPPGILALQWSSVSGPGVPTWPLADSDQLHTHMDFPVAGTYVMRLTADDGALTSSDVVTVVVGVPTVTVPDVVGLSQVAAEGAITSAGLTVGTVSTSTSTTVPAGDVISQSPVGSTSIVAGSAVDLVVSVGATPPPTTIIRVNAGGPDVTDSLGQLWSADNGFNTGSLWDDVGPVAGTVEDALYLTERWDPSGAPELEYAFTVPNGTYEVNLHFAEIANGVAYVGGRVFDVSIEGVLLEDNLDVFAQTGSAFAALIKTHTVSVTDGQINIGFGHVVEDPKISAIEIIGGGVTAPSITLSSPTPGSTVLGPDVTVNYALGGDASAYNHIHFTLDSDPYIADTSMTGTFVFAGVSAGAHTMTAQLVDASHIALTNPESLATVSFTVELPAAVPNVVGLAQAAAESAITSAGLTVGTVTNTASATVPAGDVISQNPVAASQVAPGSAVDLIVSSGPVPVIVPDLVGLAQATAESTIVSVGLAVGAATTASSDTIPSGSVISQSPLAATSVAPGTAVDLVISTGPAPVTVPDVVGLAQAAAESAITSAGLTVGTVSTSTSTTVPAGDVISQSPVGSTSVVAGSAVDLVVSVGATPPPTTIIRVNAGGPDVTDSLGQLWSADNGFNTGSLWDDVGPVAGTVEDALYLTERWDPSGAPELEYAFTVPNGTYEVNLHFAEIANGVAYVGGRVFDVSIEGVLLEDNLDVFAQTGSAFAALIKTHTVSVTDGQINIGFGHVVEDPKISAIEIASQ